MSRSAIGTSCPATDTATLRSNQSPSVESAVPTLITGASVTSSYDAGVPS